MPSLLPQPKPELPAPDLRACFESDKTKATVERVIKYIGNVYNKYSIRSWEECARADIATEEFCLVMPTELAWFDELALCEAIRAHADGLISDLEIKANLDRYLASHIFIYLNGAREVKTGDFEKWADCDLFYLYAQELDFGFTCNPVQAWLLKFLHEDINFKITRL